MEKYTKYLLTGLRIVVGWHFLYEGIAKLMIPGWSAKLYLMGSNWVFADLFHKMAGSPEIMKIVDFINIWGLILIGLSLFTGFLVRWAAAAGSILLLFYFVAYPPIPGYTFGSINEGNYVWVNKTLVEFFLLLVFAVLPTDFFYGIDRMIKRWKEEKAHAPIPASREEKGRGSLRRREFVRDLISVPFLGAFAYAAYRKKKWDSFEEKYLTGQPDSTSGATLKSFTFASLDDLKGKVPKGSIGNVELSRLIMGGNLIGGWAHARDMIYASKLVKAYHTDEKVMMTMQLAEECGVNTISTNPQLIRIIQKYWRETGGKIQFISDCGHKDGLMTGIRMSEEAGAIAMYTHGGNTDRLVQEGKFDEIAKALELIRSYGKPAGIGAHLLDSIVACVDKGIKPDFWFKTLHHHDYWSAQVDLQRNMSSDIKLQYSDAAYTNEIKPGIGKVGNMYCYDPQETIAFMNQLEEPWIAFKILAAGAIHPKNAFRYAFENGADFICVGMYDFQIVEDVNIALDSLSQANRIRPWRG